MAVEDAFSISIDDADAEKLLTPRLLTDYVMSKVTTTTATVCLTQRAFNLLRRSLIQHGGWKRSQIKPAVKLANLIPRSRRKTLLQTVTAELKIKSPPFLVRPTWVVCLFTVLSVSAGLLIVVELLPLFNIVSTILAIAVICVCGAIAASVTQPFCTEFPKKIQTVGDLSRWVMAHKSDLADATPTGWTREQIAARVREIIVDQLVVKPDFSEDANFVKDLGLS
jgi:acyl carrier protein